MKISGIGMTDIGRKRQLNEDYYICDNQQSIYLVADGMGGHQAGEVASRSAVDLVVREYYGDAGQDPGDNLVRAVKLANQSIHNQALSDPSKAGMGTTMVAAVVLGQQV